MQIPAWAVKLSTTVIMVLLTVNGWFVNRLVNYVDRVGNNVETLQRKVDVLEFAIRERPSLKYKH